MSEQERTDHFKIFQAYVKGEIEEDEAQELFRLRVPGLYKMWRQLIIEQKMELGQPLLPEPEEERTSYLKQDFTDRLR